MKESKIKFIKEFSKHHAIKITSKNNGETTIFCGDTTCEQCEVVEFCGYKSNELNKEEMEWFANEYPEHIL